MARSFCVKQLIGAIPIIGHRGPCPAGRSGGCYPHADPPGRQFVELLESLKPRALERTPVGTDSYFPLFLNHALQFVTVAQRAVSSELSTTSKWVLNPWYHMIGCPKAVTPRPSNSKDLLPFLSTQYYIPKAKGEA
eukprot:1178741-Prorocentrum_minimum.AAC.1